uniref:Galanin n=1 Tax=uncultured bacterium contig00045 TaxID=1181531 RepID=A0A806JZK0_9BACT|nr:hypothetical protein [uncultured bacterium contig00045]
MDDMNKTTAESDAAVDAVLKNTRRGRLANKIVWGCIAAPFALFWLAMIPFAFLSGSGGLFTLVISAIPLVIIFFSARAIDRALAKRSKHETTNTLLPDMAKEFFGPSATFERKKGIPVAHLKESGFFPGGWKFKTTDMVTGVRKGIQVAFSDAKVSHSEGAGEEDSVTVYDFSGLWVMCRMSRPIDGSLRLIEGMGGANVTGNVRFDAKFGVEESAQGIAAAVLTPGFIESIRRIEFVGGVLLFWLTGWDLHIAVDFHHDLFEGGGGGGGRKATSKKDVPDKDAAAYRAEFRRELERVALLVDEIAKNEHLFRTPATAPQLPPDIGG